MKPIKVYIHAVDITGELSIVYQQINLLHSTGLLNQAKEIVICTQYNENNYKKLHNDLSYYKNVSFIHFDDDYRNWFEYTTCLELQKQCNESKEDYNLLYIHGKGAGTRTIGNYHWRKYMEYFCIEKWKECVEKLEEGYDLVGAAFLNNPPHPYMAGNFFWATSDYIKRCVQLKDPREVDFKPQFSEQPHMRFDAECWNGSGNPKWYELNPGPHERWYSPPETYREDLKDKFVYRTI